MTIASPGPGSRPDRQVGHQTPQPTLDSLRTSQHLWWTTAESAGVGMALVDLDLRVFYANPALAKLSGQTVDEVAGTSIADYTRPEDLADVYARYRNILEPNPPDTVRTHRTYLHPDGHTVSALTTTSLARDDAGEPHYFIVQVQDLTDQEELQREQQLLRDHWQHAFEHSPIGSSFATADGIITQANQALAVLLGYPRAELVGKSFRDITHPDDIGVDRDRYLDLVAGVTDTYTADKRYLHADGHTLWGILHRTALRDADGKLSSILSEVVDVSDRTRALQELAYQSTHDQLTGLPNRSVVRGLLSGYLTGDQPVGLLLCNLDRFKTVNDSLGHRAGDELLVGVTDRLRSAVPATAMLARLGGDEFAVAVPGGDIAGMRDIGRTIAAALRDPVPIRRRRYTVGVSIGVSASNGRSMLPDELFREAGQAMRRAKRRVGSSAEVFDPSRDQHTTAADLQLEEELRDAVTSGNGIVAHLQPIVSLSDRCVVGYEALTRWQHPRLGLRMPGDFLPLAERSGLLADLGWRMLDLTCQLVTDPRFRGTADCWVSVNVSAHQLGQGRLIPAVQHALRTSGLEPHRLHLEITETELVDASDATMAEIREADRMGVSIALDDFGTGFSSLTLLRDLPVRTVKIDRSFITPIGADAGVTAIVRSVIGLCRDLGIHTVAEGVETREQYDSLRALNCTQAQGYLFSRPGPAW